MKRKSLTFKFVLFNLGVLLAFSSLFLFSSNSYAAISDEVNWVNSGYNTFNVYGNNPLSCTTSCDFSINNNADLNVGVQRLQLGVQAGQYYSNQIIEFNIVIWKVSTNTSLHSNFNSLQVVDNPSLKFYDIDFDNVDTNTYVAHIYVKVVSDVYINNKVQIEGINSLFMFLLQPTERISVSSWTLWQIIDTSAGTQEIVNAIQSAPNYTQSLNSIRNDIQSLQDTQEQANDDANDRYQDEKDTIDNNASDAQDSADSINPSFSITNPLTDFFNSFKDDRCVDIPNLAAWVHWDGDAKLGGAKRICSPWPTNVRDVVTPVVTGLFGLVLTGFVIRWFKGSFTTETN